MSTRALVKVTSMRQVVLIIGLKPDTAVTTRMFMLLIKKYPITHASVILTLVRLLF